MATDSRTQLSSSDKNLSKSDQKKIADAKAAYVAAEAKGDKAGMAAAHQAAESVRSAASGGTYSGSSYGEGSYTVSNYTKANTNKTSGSGGSSGGGGSNNGGSAGDISNYTTTVAQTEPTTVAQSGAVSGIDGKTTWKVGSDGKAPSNAKAGDLVVTAGGTYEIGEDGKGTLVDANTTTSTYKGGYATGGVYNVDKNGSATKGYYSAGDVIHTAGGDYEITKVNDDGSYTSQLVEGTAPQQSGAIKTATIGGKEYSARTDEGGSTIICDADGNTMDVSGAAYIDGTEYVVKNGRVGTALTSTAGALVAADTLKRTSLYDEDGNKVDGSKFQVGADGDYYYIDTGENLYELLERLGVSSSDVYIRVGNEYFDAYKNPIDMNVLTEQQWSKSDMLSDQMRDLLSAFRDAGVIDDPQLDDYLDPDQSKRWENALARASAQLSGDYQAALDDTFKDMDLQALKTGFYGQLPTEALKYQAAASNALDKQSAAYELANQLMNQEETNAQNFYNSAIQANDTKLNTLTTLYQYLYQINKDDMENINNERDYQLALQKLINDAVNQYADLKSYGYSDSELYKRVQDLYSSVK